MFTLTALDLSFQIAWGDEGFSVSAQQPEGKPLEAGVLAEVELAYNAELASGSYMPSADMIEYCTATRLGIELEPPEMDSEPGRIY